MAMSAVTNVASLTAVHSLQRTGVGLEKSQRRLATGLRISVASDDAAGLGISEGLRARIGGMKQAVRNAQDGISLLRVADGALGQTTSVLQRMRDLSVQAANDGALTPQATDTLQQEIAQLKQELQHIAQETSFNGIPLLDGTYDRDFLVGANAGETIRVRIGGPGQAVDLAGLGLSGVDVRGTAFSLPSTVTPAVSAAPGPPSAGDVRLAGDWVTPGVYQTGFTTLQGTISYNGKTFDLGSVDYTGAVTATDYLNKLNAAGMTALGISGWTPFTGSATDLTFTGAVPGPSSTTADAVALTPTYAGKTGAAAAITAIDRAIQLVSSQRATLGAVESRFDHSVQRLMGAIEDSSASESRIRDTDMAAEVSESSRGQVLMEAGMAMLAQANQSPQAILKLLAA